MPLKFQANRVRFQACLSFVFCAVTLASARLEGDVLSDSSGYRFSSSKHDSSASVTAALVRSDVNV